MTFLIGWHDADGAFLCADSAETHVGNRAGETSSFGEARPPNQPTVEECVVKLIPLPRNVVVAICGAVVPALDFLETVGDYLANTDLALAEILGRTGVSNDFEDDFDLLFAHCAEGDPTISIFTSSDTPEADYLRDGFITTGCLPGLQAALATRLVNTVRTYPLPPDARLAGSLVALQSIGIREYLPAHNVGGAFFGARVSADGVHWQPDINYLIYPTGGFRSALVGEPSGTTAELPQHGGIEKVRVLVREGGAAVISSVGAPAARLMFPPLGARTKAEWDEFAKSAFPSPSRLLVHGQHVGLLNRDRASLTYIYNPELRTTSAFAVVDRDDMKGMASIDVSPDLARCLELDPAPNEVLFTIVTDDHPEGATGKTAHVLLPDA